MRILKSKKAVSSIEVATVAILVTAAVLSFGGYFQRTIAGRVKASGDTYGQGRQYDPRGFGTNGELGGTQDCYFDQVLGNWIDEQKYRANNCDCTGLRADGVPLRGYAENCTACKRDSFCSHPPN